MSDINLSISTGTNVLTSAVGSDEISLALSSTTNVHTTAIQTNNTISIDLVGSVTPTSLLGLTDVVASSITNNQLLQFDSSSNTFFNSDLSLNELSDVTISSTASNQVLAYDATSGNFINVALDSDSFNIDASEISVNLGSGFVGRVVTANADGTLNAETEALWSSGGSTLQLLSADQAEPGILLDNRNSAAANPSYLRFRKDKGIAGADGDDIGSIEFMSDDAGQAQTLFGQILGEVAVAADTQEGGKISLKVASHDAELQPGLVIVDGDAEDEVDVTVGNGTASLTTVAGDLSITTGLILDSVDVTTIQTSAESFVNNDTSLMTSAAIQDEVLATAPAVTLAGTPDYITISGQEITRNAVVLTTDVTGTLPVSKGGTGGTDYTAGQILVGNGTSAVQSYSNLHYAPAGFSSSEKLTLTGAGSVGGPTFELDNTNAGSLPCIIRLKKSTSKTDGYDIGLIEFQAADTGDAATNYARILAEIEESGAGTEGGKLSLQVAAHDGPGGNLESGLILVDGDADAEIDVTIANGAASLTTVAGNLTASAGICSLRKRNFPISAAGSINTTQGDIVYFGTGATNEGEIVHYKSDGTWEAADANDVTKCDGLLGVALGDDPDVDGVLLRGMVTIGDIDGTEAVGMPLFLSEDATGHANMAAPAGNDDIVRIIGYALHATNKTIWFNPDSTFVQVTA